MSKHVYERKIRLDVPADIAFLWHARPFILERITPPWEKVEVIERTGNLQHGGMVVLRTYIGPIPLTWVVEHRDYIDKYGFSDELVRGPLPRWYHRRNVSSLDASSCEWIDNVEYELPLGRFGEFFLPIVEQRIDRFFKYRHTIFQNDLDVIRRYSNTTSLKVVLTGGNGLIGRSLAYFLRSLGHQVTCLKYSQNAPLMGIHTWNHRHQVVDRSAIEGCDVFIHLAGENIGSGRWTENKCKRIKESRIDSTRFFVDVISNLDLPPKTFLCASAIGIYGHRGYETVNESSSPGSGFLAEVCKEWEEATLPLEKLGIRVANLRFGVVLSCNGGALEKMLLPFKYGLGGHIGNGQQYMSWIALDDAIGAINHVMCNDNIKGPVNITSPHPTTNKNFTQALAKILRRPAILPMPALAAKVIFGSKADELLLASTKVQPKVLEDTSYHYLFPNLENAIRHLIGY